LTGRIKSLSSMSPSGFITADNGLNVYFDSSAVLPAGAAGVTVGQAVTFDLDGSKWPTAINVCLAAQLQGAPSTPRKSAAGTYLQYLGFEQTGTIRAYRFKRISRGEETREFIVNADLALFLKHHIGIQEGPELSLHLLSPGADSCVPDSCPSSRSLSQQDMLAHLARRPAGRSVKGRKQDLNI